MPPISADVQLIFNQVCAGTSAAFIVMLLALGVSKLLFGVVENDEDWNG